MHLFVSLFVYETDVVTFPTGNDFALLSGPTLAPCKQALH